MSASLSDAFVVTNLPRLPPKEDVLHVCKTSNIIDPTSNTFDISISGSFLGTFITRPSPKMVWSHSLSPQTKVSCMDSYELSDDVKMFVIGFTERNKFKMKFISYGKEESISVSNNEEDSVVNEEERTNGSEPEHFKVVKDKLITVSNEILNIKFSKTGEFVYSLHSNGDICVWKFSLDEEHSAPSLTFENENIVKSNAKSLIFSTFIKPEDLKLDSRSNKVETLLLTLEDKDDKSLNVKIHSIKNNEILEIFNSILPASNEGSSNSQFAYDPSGKLVCLNASKMMLTSYELPNVAIKKSVSIDAVFEQEPVDSLTSIMVASTNRVLVTKGSTLALIDLKFNALLSSMDLYPRSKELGSVKPPRTATLLNVPIVMGNTMRSKVTFALLILKNYKENYAQIQHVSVDTGLGKLSDALGKALPGSKKETVITKDTFIAFTQYINQKTPEIDDVEGMNLKMKKKSDELINAYNNLKSNKKSGDINKLQKSIIAFLKCEKDSNLDFDNFKVYDFDSDRIVDPKFFKLVTKMLFDFDEETQRLSLDSEKEIPEMGITYILTHPLFPRQFTHGLLKVLEVSPRLLRQAIVTCVNIPCGDLIEQLSIVENDEIFRDIISRMITDFSTDEITKETIRLMKRKRSEKDTSDFDLNKIINRILRLNTGYEILNSFIDSNGLVLSLHYSKDESQLDRLIQQTKDKVDDLLEDSHLAVLVEQALLNAKAKKSSSKKTRKSKNKKKDKHASTSSDNITEDQSKSSLLLSIGDVNSLTSESKKATYTIDKLQI